MSVRARKRILIATSGWSIVVRRRLNMKNARVTLLQAQADVEQARAPCNHRRSISATPKSAHPSMV